MSPKTPKPPVPLEDKNQTGPAILKAKVGRRSFIAGSAGLAFSGSYLSFADKARASKPGKSTDFDAIVIGAGFAGATAAREIGNRGNSCLVLEARSRLGGRTFTSEFMGESIEFGGAWVHWLQPNIWPELERYGRQAVEDPVVDIQRSFLLADTGKRQDVDPETFFADLQAGLESFTADSRELFPQPFSPQLSPQITALDQQSAAQRLDQLKLSPRQKMQLRSILTLYGGTVPENFGVPGFIKLVALAGWNIPAWWDAESHYRIEGGTLGLIQDMLADSGAEVQLGTPVSAVEQIGKNVKVVTEDGETFTARTCVVSVPLSTLKEIKFSPSLSPERLRLMNEGIAAEGAKLYVHIKEDIGRVFGLSDQNQPLTWVQTHSHSPSEGTILSITVGRTSQINVNDPAQVENAIQNILPGTTFVSSVAYDWTADPFSRGAWPAYRVGQFTRVSALREKQGNILFAGSATAKGWHEFIDGAVESGIRTGREAREILDS